MNTPESVKVQVNGVQKVLGSTLGTELEAAEAAVKAYQQHKLGQTRSWEAAWQDATWQQEAQGTTGLPLQPAPAGPKPRKVCSSGMGGPQPE